MLEQIGSVASILGFLKEPVAWIRRRLVRKAVRIEAVIERGPVTRRSGFTEPAIKVTVMNESKRSIKIRDIRLMFCGNYGAPVKPRAPEGTFYTLNSLWTWIPERMHTGTFPQRNSTRCFAICTSRRQRLGQHQGNLHFTQDVSLARGKFTEVPFSDSHVPNGFSKLLPTLPGGRSPPQ